MRRIHLFALAVLAWVAPLLHADESLTPAVLKEIKDATVFIKVDAGVLRMSGSGFLIKLSGGAAYIVTNNHVIDTSGPHVVESDAHHHRTITTNRVPDIKAVFSSGTPDELSLPAQVVAADKNRDLAILLVKGVTRQIKPIDLNVSADLVETTPVFVFGFPFGEALSIEGHNPAITVGRGAISSVRLNQKREVAAVQIDGALNPGNSGGPVVDARGHLAGVAVATIVGSGIGLAIPPSEVKRELAGRLGIARVVAARDANKKNLFTAHVTVAVIDPMSQIRSVTFYWVPASAAERLNPESHLSELPTAHKLLLKVEGAEASGSFDVTARATGQTDIVYEASYISGGAVNFSARSDPMNLGEEVAAITPPEPAVPVPANQGAAVAGAGPAIPAPAGGGEYIDAALTALASEDGHTQITGADQLRIAPLDESRRGAVLAALAPHLASDDLGLRVACVKAYVHWATVKEVKTLAKVAETPQEHAELGGAMYAWASAVVGLVRLDPAAAQRVYAARKSDFFFCDATSAALLKLAEYEPQHAGTVSRLLREFDVFHPIIKFSVPEAIQMLQSDAASTRAQGCEALMIAPIDSSQRKQVLALLAAHLNAADGGARVRYVRAYMHWIDASNLKDLRPIVDFPKAGPMNDHDRCWAAAVIGMVHQRAMQAVIDAYNSRAGDNVWLEINFSTALRELAETTAPEQALAWSLLQQFNNGRASRLHPTDAIGAKALVAAEPPPDAPTAKKADAADKPVADNPVAEAPKLPIPAGALHGQIRGKAFIPDRIEMQNGWLIIRSGKAFFPDKEIKIAFHVRPGEPIGGRKYHVELGDREKPVIFISRMQPGDKLPQTFVPQRYRMDVEFGTLANDKLPGKIKLVVEDEQGVDLTGSFVADFK